MRDWPVRAGEYERFLGAAAIQRALAQPELLPVAAVPEPQPVPTITARRRPLRFVAPLLTLAAMITIVVLLRSRSATPDVMQFAEAARVTGGSLSQRLGTAWDDRGWSVMRGGDSGEDGASRAFRAGVRLAQLTMAANAGDSAAVARQAGNLTDLLATVEGASPLVMRLPGMVQESHQDPGRTRLELASQLRALLGSADWFDLGVWTESAHMAAQNGDVDFFAVGGAPLTALTRLLHRPGMPAEQWTRETRALRALPDHGASARSELPAIDEVLTKVLAAAGA